MSLPTSTYTQSSHVEHLRFDLSPKKLSALFSLSSTLPLSLSLSLVCPGLMQCCVLYAGPWLAIGTPGFTPRQELDGGEWERCVSQPKESATFVPHSPRGPPALKPIASAGIRSDRVNGPFTNFTNFKYIHESCVKGLILFPWCRNECYCCSPGKRGWNSHKLSSVSEQSLWWQVSRQC